MTVEMVCPYCRFSRVVRLDKIPPGAKSAICPSCRQRFEFASQIKDGSGAGNGLQREDSPGEEGDTRSVAGKGEAPWENLTELGTWRAITSTVKATLFSPGTFFRSLTSKGGQGKPFAFGLTVGSLGGMFSLFWHFLSVTAGGERTDDPVFGRMGIGLFFLTLIIIIPVMVTVGIYIYSGILHLMLLLLRGGKNGFEATFRVVAYSEAAQLWGLIPFIGGAVGGIWQLIVLIIGLREIQEASFYKVIMAFILPLVLISMIFILAMIPVLFTFIDMLLRS